MTKGCIYYTDNRLNPVIMEVCQKQLRKAFDGKIVSVSLKPMDFGTNIYIEGLIPSYFTMLRQIVTALEVSSSDVVFFTEHDVLYHPSHFEFTLTFGDVYYYNTNDWRWDYPKDRLINYDGLTSLSMMCCNRQLALMQYKKRLNRVLKDGLYNKEGKEPEWARKWGYEPGRKRTKRGGFSDEKSDTWKSKYPNIDIRHNRTFSRRKVTLEEFKHKPDTKSWRETSLDKIDGWQDIKKMFDL